MPIEFEQITEQATFYSPLADFDLDTRTVEYRTDPLTGEQTRVVTEWFPERDGEFDVESYAGDGEDCFFCPGTVEESTPEYPDFVGVDRGSVGEATSFPNLFPYGEHSNVVVLTEDHFRPLEGFETGMLADGLASAFEYVTAVVAHDGSTYASVNMNYLPPSGSSVVHPHLQAIVDDHGTNEARRRLEAARDYRDEHGRGYWSDLCDEEREGPRYIGATGDVEWFAPFAPMGQYHVRGVTGVGGVPDPGDSVLADLASGIEGVLRFYDDCGLDAFNFALQAVDDPTLPAVLDVVARPGIEDQYVNDAFYLQTLHDERVVDVAPEAYAPDVGAFV